MQRLQYYNIQMYRVNKNNNKRCTRTSDENHCALNNRCFEQIKTDLFQGQTTIINQLLCENENCEACSSLKSAMASQHKQNQIMSDK